MTDELLVDVADGIMTITLNRPQSRNAVTLAMAHSIAAAVDELDLRDDLRAAVITGAGGSFCAGMDLKGFARGEVPRLKGRGFAGLTNAPPRKPLIAAVEGHAVGGGLEIVLECDLVVAADDARLGLTEVRHGLVAGSGLLRLPRRVSRNIAMELALTGELLSASRLHACGLVNRLVPAGQALHNAQQLAHLIAGHQPAAVLAGKRVVDESIDWPATERTERQSAITDPVNMSPSAHAGARAFARNHDPAAPSRSKP